MTNSINVPRELLERCCKRMYDMMQGDLHEELRALLSAPSPAGVDGLEVVGIQWLDTGHYRKKQPKYGFNPYDWKAYVLCDCGYMTSATAAIAAARKGEGK